MCPPTVVVDDPNDAYYQALDEADRSRYDLQLEACQESGGEELLELRRSGRAALGDELVGRLDGVLLRTHPDLTDTYAAWSGCMAGHDADFESPIELVASIEQRAATAGPDDRDALFAEELRLATAYFDCHQEHSRAVYARLVQELDAEVLARLGADGLLPAND